MLFFLTLTQNCNLACTYCGSDGNADIENILEEDQPKEIRYKLNNLEKLKNIKDDLIICFYGGEPLLKPRVIKKVIEMHPNAKFCLQTNGTLLNRFNTKLTNQMDTILISVDGGPEVTNKSRGNGTWERAINNARYIRKNGYKNDLVARMTVSNVSNVYEDVRYLIELDDGLFDHVHWQLDTQWSTPCFAGYDNFLDWRDNNYNVGITKLINWFEKEIVEKSRVLGIAPFLQVLHDMITGRKSRLRCGSGLDSFNVDTGGEINPCPIAPETHELAMIQDENFQTPESLRDSVKIAGLCTDCEILDLCGGRCLYANQTMWWGEEGFKEVCVTVKHLMNELKRILPSIKQAIADGKITLEDLNYPKYNNSVEVIP